MRELNQLGVRFLCLGLTTYESAVHGRWTMIEIQFEDLRDPRIETAAATVASQWNPSLPDPGLSAPVGNTVEVHADPPGVSVFALEYEYMAEVLVVGDVPVRALSAARVCKRRSEIAAALEPLWIDPVERAREVLSEWNPDSVGEAKYDLSFSTEGAGDGYVFVTISNRVDEEPDEDSDLGLETGSTRPRPPTRGRRSKRADYSACLVLNAPLRFGRVVPSGMAPGGLEIVVEILSDLTVVVTHQGERVLEGAYEGVDVRWNGGATPATPACARSMVGADVRDMLSLFRRELDACRWTENPRALELLAAVPPARDKVAMDDSEA